MFTSDREADKLIHGSGEALVLQCYETGKQLAIGMPQNHHWMKFVYR